jgi:hypothetical protein
VANHERKKAMRAARRRCNVYGTSGKAARVQHAGTIDRAEASARAGATRRDESKDQGTRSADKGNVFLREREGKESGRLRKKMRRKVQPGLYLNSPCFHCGDFTGKLIFDDKY